MVSHSLTRWLIGAEKFQPLISRSTANLCPCRTAESGQNAVNALNAVDLAAIVVGIVAASARLVPAVDARNAN